MRHTATFPEGVWPVLLTPYRADGGLDMDGYASLLEYDIAHGVSGLFAVCLSSELFQLSPAERLALARGAVACARERVPVVACAGFGESLSSRLDDVKAMADTGVNAVVLPIGFLASPEEDEEALARNFGRLLEQTGETVFGLYECPLPYRRLFSAECLLRLSRLAGPRLAFLKDTCCNRAMLRQRLEALRGTPLKLYNANLVTFLDSLWYGAAGYSGTSANFYPALLSRLVRTFRQQPEQAARIQEFMTLVQRHVECKYPRSAKAFLASRGVAIQEGCRVACDELNGEDREQLAAFGRALQAFEDALGQ